GGFDGKACGGEFGDYRGDVAFGDVDEEEILHGRGAEMAVGETIGQVGGLAELLRSDAATNYGGADGIEAGLLLGLDTQVIAMNVRGKVFGFGGIEFVAETPFDGG